jgi:uncharacterized protein YjlB
MRIDEKNGEIMSSLARTCDNAATGVQALWFDADGWVPNNQRLPVLHYRQAVGAAVHDGAAAFEKLFSRNGWRPQWRNGIYSFHHYHSNAHEVLGIAAGNACVQLGGPQGTVVAVKAGDCVLLPAGTGHCLVESNSALLVVGAYPPGHVCDLRREALSSAERAVMAALPKPACDPVTGHAGAMVRLWALSK